MEQQSSNRPSDEDVVIQGHLYDGIREYDNPMPGWWLWILWGCILWSPFYILGVHFSDVIPTYEESLASSQAELEEIQQAFSSANPGFEATPEALAAYQEDPSHVASGADLYATYCAACHGSAGEGLIGPNLTDAFWIHGSSDVEIYNVITEGVVSMGMAPWGPVLSAEERAQLVGYIRSIEGTNPPNAKPGQGEEIAAQ